VALLVIMLTAVNDMTAADGRGTLLTSHAIYSAGTLKLDAYPELASPDDYKFDVVNGHVYYALALGAPVLCVPVVAIADWCGWSAVDLAVESRLQRVVAAFSVALIFLILLATFRLRLGYRTSLVLSLTFVLGTAFSSTLGVGLWNQDLEVPLLLLALYLILRAEYCGAPLPGFWLGLALGAAYVVRPTALIAIGMSCLYVLIRRRAELPRVILGMAICVGGLVAMSYAEFGYALPPYYRAVIQEETWHHNLVLRGLLISPGRGLFVFSPFLILPVIWVLIRFRRLERKYIGLAAVIWLVAQVLAMSRHVHWWGGTCFGPRLLTDAVVALVPIAFAAADDYSRLRAGKDRQLACGLFVLLATASMFIHTVQGLYNRYTLEWNRRPSVETNVFSIFDWEYPQFFTTNERLNHREIKYVLPQLPIAGPGEQLTVTSGKLLLLDWAPVSQDSDGLLRVVPRAARPRLGLRLGDDAAVPGELALTFAWGGASDVVLLVDNIEIGRIHASGPAKRTEVLPLQHSPLARLLGDRRSFVIDLEPAAPTGDEPALREFSFISLSVR